MTGEVLGDAVAAFCRDLAPIVVAWPESAGANPERVGAGLRSEAHRIAAAIVQCDRRVSDREREAMTAVFGGVAAEPDPGRDFWHHPSLLFVQLLEGDRANGTDSAWRYYEAALLLAHAAAALADFPTHDTLLALDEYRGMLLRELRANGIARPVSPPPARPPGPATRLDPPTDAAEPSSLAAPDAAAASAPPVAAPTLDELLEELEMLVGLDAVKREVKLIVDLARVEQLRVAHDLPVAERSRHLVFTGNPGTGKTTVARLLGRIYAVLGVLGGAKFVETDRSGLVAGFVGQTAPKVREVVTSAIPGMLFIDEAYALTSGGREDFGAEAIATLLKLMEDHREELVVVAAGYTSPMAVFVASNPGLESRFAKMITFPDYSTDDLVEIFRRIGDSERYVPDADALAAVRAYLDAVPRTESFGNARLVRNVFEAAVARQATRVLALDSPSAEVLSTLVAADIPEPGSTIESEES